MLPQGEIWHTQPKHKRIFFLYLFWILKCLVYLIYKDKVPEKTTTSALYVSKTPHFSDQFCKGCVLPGSNCTDNRANS